MFERVEHGSAYLTEESLERGRAGKARAQDKGIDQVPHEAGQIGSIPTQGWGTDQDVFLSGVPIQEHLEGGKENGEQGRAL
jgi:hypothetical protein